MPGDRVRDEAERLVAAAIAAVSYATRGLGSAARPGSGFATDSPECCVCPVCRTIAAMRDPAPEIADKLAAGVGDLAAGVTAILRTLSQRTGREDTPEPPSEGDEFWESLRRKAADAAKAAARATSTMDPTRGSTVDDDPWHVATTADRSTTGQPAAGTATPAVAKKTVAKKTVAKKSAAPAQPSAAAADAPVAKKVVAKKAAKKAAPARENGA